MAGRKKIDENKKIRQVAICMSNENKAVMEFLAEREGVSTSNLVLRLILEENERVQKIIRREQKKPGIKPVEEQVEGQFGAKTPEELDKYVNDYKAESKKASK